MGVRFSCSSTRPFEVEEIRQVLEAVRSAFADVRELEARDTQLGGFKVRKRLPPVDQPDGVRMPTLYVSARMPADAWSASLARDMLSRFEAAWSGIASLGVECQHVEKDAEYRAGGPLNEIGAEVRKGGRHLSYSAYQGRLWQDDTCRQQFFTMLIDRLGLPMRVNRIPEGYLLEHAGGGELWLSGGGRGNHKCFCCELPGVSIDRLVELLEVFREELLDGRVVGYGWRLSNLEDRARPNLGKELYDWLVGAALPVQTAEVEFGCGLTDVRGLDGLKALYGPKGRFLTHICTFGLPSGERAALWVRTRCEEHYLEVEVPLPKCLAEVQAALNLPLKKRPSVL